MPYHDRGRRVPGAGFARIDFAIREEETEQLAMLAISASASSTVRPPLKDEMNMGVWVFDRNFASMLTNPNDRMARVAGPFDRIFVGGKSVSEICARQTRGYDEREKEDYMKTYVAAVALARNKRIDIVSEINPGVVSTVSVISRVYEKEQPMNFFQRFLNKVGLYKTGPEKREEDYRDIVNINRTEEEARRKGIEKTFSDNRGKLEAARMREFTEENEKERFAIVDTAFTEAEKAFLNTNPSKHLRTGRMPERLIIAQLFNKGHSFEDIMNPDMLKDEKKEAGRESMAMIKRDDPLETAALYLTFAENYNKLEALPIDHTNTGDLLKQRREIFCRSNIAFDVGQEFNNTGGTEFKKMQFSSESEQEAFKKRYDQKFDGGVDRSGSAYISIDFKTVCQYVTGNEAKHEALISSLTYNSELYDTLKASMAPAQNMDDAQTQLTMCCVHARKEAGGILNNAQTVGAIDLAKAEAACENRGKIQVAAGDLHREFRKLAPEQKEAIIQGASRGCDVLRVTGKAFAYNFEGHQPMPLGRPPHEAGRQERDPVTLTALGSAPAMNTAQRVAAAPTRNMGVDM
jgi:hypothetical protein